MNCETIEIEVSVHITEKTLEWYKFASSSGKNQKYALEGSFEIEVLFGLQSIILNLNSEDAICLYC